MNDQPDLTVQEVADLLQVHPETVKKFLRRGELRGYALGRRSGWRIPREALNDFKRKRMNVQIGVDDVEEA